MLKPLNCYFKNLLTYAQQIQFRRRVKEAFGEPKTFEHRNNTRLYKSIVRLTFDTEPTEEQTQQLVDIATDIDDQIVCKLCRSNYTETSELWVGDCDPPVPPSGIMTLEAKYRVHNICTRCWHNLEKQVVERQRQRPHGDWITWEEDGKHYAHCPGPSITWELLPSGRPKKLPVSLLPPYLRSAGTEGLTNPNGRYPYWGNNET